MEITSPNGHENTHRAERVESISGMRHRIDVNGRNIEYTASAGTLIVSEDGGKPIASMFYVAYVADRPAGAANRPVTFLYNGGPGSASLWLNIGGFGPKRAPTRAPFAAPPAPYAVGDNPYTLLDKSDLVFIDAVGTGYSRMLDGTIPAQVWGVDQDVDVYARAIIRYLTVTESWNSPRFLFGESYGTARSAALVHTLQNQGVDINGVVLLSAILNWTTKLPGADQNYINSLPSLAAAAWYHKRQEWHPDDITEYLEEVRRFAQGRYAQALQLGDWLSTEEEAAVAAELGRHLGLDAEYIKRSKLRIEMEQFRRAILADDGKVIGRFDARFVGEDSYLVGNGSFDPATDDAATAGVNSAHLAAFRDHLTEDIGYRSELRYLPLNNMLISSQWDWHHKAPGIDAPLEVPNVALDLAAAMRRNPNLKVVVLGGIYDLATPYFDTEYEIAHLYLSEDVRANIGFVRYESGHMTFVDESAVMQMKVDLDAFYDSATVQGA